MLGVRESVQLQRAHAYDYRMSDRESPEVRVISDDVSYSDSAEGELLDILGSAHDRSTQSDELASHIHDWPTRYHLSPLRANLLTPLTVNAGDRVLEVGCGTGVNVRAMAERGAKVVGIEGTRARAAVAIARNAEFDSVEIFAGDIAEYLAEDLFDVVLVVGVLEYVSSGIGGLTEPVEFLKKCVSFLKPDGLLILAIENQLGLKYLLSYPEDHLGIPWVGLEGYRRGQPRTWSRAALRDMLNRAGLSHQEFFSPFPDYKLPTAVIRDRLFSSEAGRELVKNFIRRPVVDHSGSPQYVCDAQLAYSQFVDAEIGPEVSNSFLVFASANAAVLSNRVDGAEMWLASAQRRRKFRNFRRVLAESNSFHIVGSRPGEVKSGDRRSEWLLNRGQLDGPVYRGTPLEDQIFRAVLNSNWNEVTKGVVAYREFLLARSAVAGLATEVTKNPFSVVGDELSISGTFIDCVPQNLLVSPEGQLILVDHEWEADGLCSLNLIFLRGLLILATRILEGGLSTKFRRTAPLSIMDVALELAASAGFDVDEIEIERLLKAEFAFQELVLLPQPKDFNGFRDSMLDRGKVSARSTPVLRLIEVASEHERALKQNAELHSEWLLIDADRGRILAARDRDRADLDELKKQVQSLSLAKDEPSLSEMHLRREIKALRTSSAYRVGRAITSPVRLTRLGLRRFLR